MKYLFIYLVGALASLAFAPYFLLPCGMISIAILYHYVSRPKINLKHITIISFCWGVGYFSANLYWLANAIMFDLENFWFFIPLAVLGLPALFAIIYIVPLSIIISKSKQRRGLGAVFFAMIWVIFEYLMSILFTGFPWVQFGYVLAFNKNIIQIASVFGVYGLSYLVVLSSILLYEFFLFRKIKYLLVVFLIFLGAWFYGSYHFKSEVYNNDLVKIRLVQPNINMIEKSLNRYNGKNIQKLVSLSKLDPKFEPDIIIWPESSLDFYINDVSELSYFNDVFSDETLIFTNIDRIEFLPRDKIKKWNSSLLFSTQGKVYGFYDKMHLVPFGEYIPFLEYINIPNFTNGYQNYEMGNEAKLMRAKKIPPFIPLICYEGIFAQHPEPKDADNARWIVNITNDSWYGDVQPYQHMHITRFRAIEKGLPLARVTTTGISFITDAFGKMIEQTQLNMPQKIDVVLPNALKDKPLYRKYGFWTNIFLFLISYLLIRCFERMNNLRFFLFN